jgi:hypothetical protein
MVVERSIPPAYTILPKIQTIMRECDAAYSMARKDPFSYISIGCIDLIDSMSKLGHRIAFITTVYCPRAFNKSNMTQLLDLTSLFCKVISLIDQHGIEIPGDNNGIILANCSLDYFLNFASTFPAAIFNFLDGGWCEASIKMMRIIVKSIPTRKQVKIENSRFWTFSNK